MPQDLVWRLCRLNFSTPSFFQVIGARALQFSARIVSLQPHLGAVFLLHVLSNVASRILPPFCGVTHLIHFVRGH
jgi:hypothetical protein